MAKSVVAPPVDNLQAVERYCSTKVVASVIDEMNSADRNEALATVVPRFVDEWYDLKKQPKNPSLTTPIASCKLIVKPSMARVELAPNCETVSASLQTLGVNKKRSQHFDQFVTTESEPEFVGGLSTMRASDNAAVRDAANELYAAIMAKPEWQVLVKSKKQLLIVPTFMSALPTEASSKEEMRKLVKVFSPQMYFAEARHTSAFDTVQARYAWEQQNRTDVETPNGKHRLTAIGKKVLLFKKSDGGWVHVSTVEKANAAEAVAFLQSASKDPLVFATLLALAAK